MPILIASDPKEGLNFPGVFCDICCERITDSTKGLYIWELPHEKSNPTVYFVHAKCNAILSDVWRGRKGEDRHFDFQNDRGEVINSKVFVSCWQPLDCFPIWLGRNVGMTINATGKFRDHFGDDSLGLDLKEVTLASGQERVYFVVDNECIERKVKIGWSKDVRGRLKDMQTGSPAVLKFYGAVPGGEPEEKLAHRLLDRWRSHGEWFVFRHVRDIVDEWLELGKIFDTTTSDQWVEWVKS